MAITLVGIGSAPNDGTGVPARTAFDKINGNFTDAENAASKLVATTAQAKAGTAGVLPDAAGTHAAIRELMVGTVSQSGGIPTGAVIERGSNASGYYEKLASGFIIQYHNTGSSQAISTADSVNGFVSATQTWTYPVAMVSTISYQATGFSTNVQFHTGVGASSASYRWTAVNSQTATTRNAGLLVIGRWF